eukprot:CAMPEP_0180779758 /NCGR_PEP_ID=MMETSP1038_2-20121128/46600_1 /TAXON_ID=632150 /ORGANISM="Azadinium spinosum, Strain 3D9" /LENGTH=62 /DNA_ID=CAMNT_0022815159 /DNA_START=706 /DNA_END=894 /DNA_ORIENTATION=-
MILQTCSLVHSFGHAFVNAWSSTSSASSRRLDATSAVALRTQAFRYFGSRRQASAASSTARS